jgi:hypothetical protein
MKLISIQDVLSMAEMVAAILVVCLPALKSLIHHVEESTSKGQASNGSRDPYKHYATGSSHIKLSSGRDPYSTTTRVVTTTAGEDSGSEVELNTLNRKDVIYKSERVSVTYQQRDESF